MPESTFDASTRSLAADPPLAQSRPAVPVLADASPDADSELERLLARRRRQVFVILAAVYALFVGREVVMAVASDGGSRLQGGLLVAALAVQLAVIALFRSGRPNWSRWLSSAEWVTLATFWLTQGANQLATLDKPAEVQVLIDRGLVGQVLTANTWLLPWFALIAGYPVMVPNAVRRTAVIVAVTAAVPVLVTALASALNPDLTFARTWLMYVQFVLWGLVGVSISVYGSFQATALRREAFEAKQFGQYRLVRKLGQGGMGEVHLAEHRLLRRPSVIKLIRPDRRHDPRTVLRFEREVRVLATLTHWNKVEVYDYGHTPDGTFYFVMEYLPGQDLQRLVDAHGPLPPGRAVYLLAQVCRGLREAHGVGLIHRDIKPANVMACRRGGLTDVAKVLDFGLVQAPDDAREDDSKLTREGMVMGTPAFLSPEQATARPADARTDIYSLGGTAFYLLTGRAPFEREKTMEVVAAHITEPPPDPRSVRPEVPADLAAVVLKCLAKAPADRFATVRDLETALLACGCAADWDEDRAAEWWEANDAIG